MLYIYKQAPSTRIFSTKNKVFGYANSQTRNIYKQLETSTTHTHATSAMCARGANVDIHFRDIFSMSPIQTSPTSLWAQFMYYIILYFFKHDPSPCDLWRKFRKFGLKDMGRFLSDLLHEPRPSVLPSGQGILVAPQAYGEGLVPKISTSKELSCSR